MNPEMEDLFPFFSSSMSLLKILIFLKSVRILLLIAANLWIYLILAAVEGISVEGSPDAKTAQAAMKENYWKRNSLVSTQQEGKTGTETSSCHME